MSDDDGLSDDDGPSGGGVPPRAGGRLGGGRRWRLHPVGLLTRYTLWEVAVPALLALAVIGFLAVAVEMRERVRALPMEHLTGSDVGRLVVYFLPTLVTYVVPITYMMGILLAFGRLAQNNEITAMKAAGIPLKRVVVPVLMGGAVLSVACFYVQDRVQPEALKRANDLIYNELPLRITLDVLPTGQMHEFGDWRVYIRERDPDTRMLKDVEILVPQKDGTVWAYWAESARLVQNGGDARIQMPNCHLIIPQEDGGAMRMVLEDAQMGVPKLSRNRARSLRRTLPLRGLLEHEAEVRREYEATPSSNLKDELRKTRWEIGERFSLPLACLSVSLLAAPLAVRGRRGGRSYSFAIGFTMIIVYQGMRLLIEPHSLHPLGDVLLRGLVPNILLALAGVWALWRVDRV
ncbi:MAG: LptF/LptG family permease [Candidatus Hydrogenedentes bacterium]|nr:LptF/LptG family permease [Candidatus Hydrogenedentota bacterium]